MRTTKITFSNNERKDLTKSWLAISLAVAIAYTGLNAGLDLLTTLLAASITVGVGFLLHELAHKIVAIRYGCAAHFKANTPMLWLAIIISLAGVVFAAPGAVQVRGAQSERESGVISLAGPLTNVALAISFLTAQLLTPNGWWSILLFYGAIVNAWLALFNMIPVAPLDGRKVWVWNKTIYITTVITSIALLMAGLTIGGI